jgi:hypothetical protein
MVRPRSRSVAALAIAALAACSPGAASGPVDNAVVCNAYAQHLSRVEVDAEGAVTRVLGTRPGRQSPHTGFLVKIEPCGATVRVEANTNFTGVVPVRAGDDVVMRGEYEYYAQGGVIHWTHRDPRGRHPGGYVKVGGTTYQ